MRTVDPEEWYHKLKNGSYRRSRKFGRPKPSGFEFRLRQSFRQVTKEWRETTSAPSAKYVFDENKTLFERVCAALLLACSVAWCAWLFGRLAAAAPAELSLEPATTPLPSAQVPFPAVAFCSYNLISKKKLLDFLVDLIYEEDFNSSSIETVARNAAQMASIVTWTRPALDVQFLHLLDGIPRQKYNITEILFYLSPQCSELAWRCSWRGVAAACSGLLAPRLTPNGYCCVFNGRYMPEDINTPVKYLNVVGAERGLNVYLEENTEDFIYLRGLSEGIEVHVFDSTNFPLMEAGALQTFTVRRNTCVYAAVKANVQTMVKSTNFQYKHCERYGGEGGDEAALRSRGHCVAACRRRAAAALCGCVPPTLLPLPADQLCTLTDVVCLNKHRGKFLYFNPEWSGSAAPRELQEELTDSLDCDCPPPCARTQYNLRVYHSADTFHNNYKFYMNAHTIGAWRENMSVVKVYFDSEKQVQYLVQPHSHVLNSFAFIASVWFCVTSLNLATLLEMVFFWGLRLTVTMILNRPHNQ